MGNSLFEPDNYLPYFNYSSYCSKKKEGETPIYRNPKSYFKLRETAKVGTKTVWEVLEKNIKTYGENENFICYRKTLDNGKMDDKPTWLTYSHFKHLSECFAKGLRSLNLCPVIQLENERDMRFMGIYSKNKIQWFLGFYGCVADSVTVTTIYETLGNKGLEWIINQTKLKTILVDAKILELMFGVIEGNKGTLKNLIVIDKTKDEDEIISKIKNHDINIYTFDEIIEEGEKYDKNYQFKRPKPDDIVCVYYTSGTTGVPKGAKTTHNSLVVNTDALDSTHLELSHDDIYYSYLPLAHIMESLLIQVIMTRGAKISIYSGNVKKIGEDTQIFKPTCMVAVPRVLQRVYEGIITEINKLNPILRRLFNKGISMKMNDFQKYGTLKNPLFDLLFFEKIRKKFGGSLKWMIIGSAPIDSYILNFLRCALCIPIIIGYGQTEDCAANLVSFKEDNNSVHTGGPSFSCEIKLVDIPELGYNSTDVDEITGIPAPRGEICVRGPIVFCGYLVSPEKTKEALDEDGWLHTGDVGRIFTERGNAVTIIDRVKNIFKLQQGEYIAPEKLEAVLLNNRFVDQIFISGNSNENYIIAIIYPNQKEVINYFKNCGKTEVTEENWTNYLSDEGLNEFIVSELEKFGRDNDFKGFEVVKKIYLTPEQFTQENDLLSPTMKVKRFKAQKSFNNVINSLYDTK